MHTHSLYSLVNREAEQAPTEQYLMYQYEVNLHWVL